MDQSFDDFVHSHQQALVRYATLLSGGQGEAEDLVQEVLIRVYPRWETLDGSRYAYVRRAVTNEFLSWRRRWSTRHIRPTAEIPETPVGLEWSEPDERLALELGKLPRQQRAAVVLRYYEDLTDTEIAAVLGVREASVRSHISRGLAALRSVLGTSERAWRGHE
ncbi:SigE family RNA polymerase sigma factor [Kutzneria sp. CA-103260]|uniref:SigE family RNA polymerase sigma factor n=1 Tax=Kutzneria sp. CA-103260 TaxID=2802641 RepID=UPI001BAA4CB2|nr:SigE family RNA polymerase sigma factor [Kutzneria sp. CA-103260]QUQ66672.1 ECF subfamily RNA polymerase sigma-24 factor [Kutzneria sp. CA-103260]